jgi:hypothetical protein
MYVTFPDGLNHLALSFGPSPGQSRSLHTAFKLLGLGHGATAAVASSLGQVSVLGSFMAKTEKGLVRGSWATCFSVVWVRSNIMNESDNFSGCRRLLGPFSEDLDKPLPLLFQSTDGVEKPESSMELLGCPVSRLCPIIVRSRTATSLAVGLLRESDKRHSAINMATGSGQSSGDLNHTIHVCLLIWCPWRGDDSGGQIGCVPF